MCTHSGQLLMRMFLTAVGWLSFSSIASANSIVEPKERGHNEEAMQPQVIFADFLLNSNVPFAFHTMIFKAPWSSTRNNLFPTWSHQDLHGFVTPSKTRSPQFGEPLIPCFVNLQSPQLYNCEQTRSSSPRMATDTGNDADEWSSASLSAAWRNLQVDRATQVGRADDMIKGISSVWVLVSNLGNSQEVVYTMQGRTGRDPLYVLAFEQQSDAERYAHLAGLSRRSVHMTPIKWKAEQLRSFCHRGGLEVALGRHGQTLIPPFTSTVPSQLVNDDSNSWRASEDRAFERRHVAERPVVEEILQESGMLPGVSKGWIVMINPGQSGQGVFTLQSADTETQNLLVFEDKADAIQFTEKLQADNVRAGVDHAAPAEWDAGELRSFCEEGGFEIRFVSKGTSMSPPRVIEYDVEAFSKLGAVEEERAKRANSISWAESQDLPLHRALALQNQRALQDYLLSRSVPENSDVDI